MNRPFQSPSTLVALLAFASTGTSLCASTVDVILPAATVVTEQQPDRRFDPSTILGTLQTGITAAPDFHLLLLAVDRLLSEDDRAVMIVPVVTSARSSREVKAGAVVEITAHVGGGLWVLDPWTNTALYAATRLVSAPVRVSVDVFEREDELTRAAFREASTRWVEACLDQLRREASPFIVEGTTAAIPDRALQTRGIWLRGSSHGVRPGMVIRSTSGALALVETVSKRFSTIRDAAESNAKVPPGISFRSVSVSRPTQRPEPVVVVRWLGREPMPPDEVARSSVLSAAAVTDIAQSYAAKGGGLRFVPASSGGLAANKEFQELSEYVSRHTRLATTSTGMTLHRETRVRMAEEEPSVVAEVGVLGAHHGVRNRPDGAREHLFRVSLLAAVGTPSAGGGMALAKTVDAVAELAVVEMNDVRDVDQADAWFSVWRNASILLGEKVRAAALETVARMGMGTVEAWVKADGAVAWPAVSPGPYSPLTWLRPAGEVIGPDGLDRLGVVLERVEPSQGFLTPGNLMAEKVRPGDVLAYRAGSGGRPRVALVIGGDGAAADVVLDVDILSRMGASALESTAGVTPHLDSSTAPWRKEPLVQILVGHPTIEEALLTTKIEGNWRCRLWIDGVPDVGDAAVKAGIAYREERRYEGGRPPLLPRDRNAELIVWARNALQQVVSKAVERGLGKAVGAGAPATTVRKE